MNRHGGGMRAGAHLLGIVSALSEVLKESNSPVVHVWALHSLCLTIEAAGTLSFPPHYIFFIS